MLKSTNSKNYAKMFFKNYFSMLPSKYTDIISVYRLYTNFLYTKQSDTIGFRSSEFYLNAGRRNGKCSLLVILCVHCTYSVSGLGD